MLILQGQQNALNAQKELITLKKDQFHAHFVQLELMNIIENLVKIVQ